MQAGNLRKRVTVQQKSGTQDDFGQFVASWQTVATVWAEVEMAGGSEQLHTKQVQSEDKYKVTMRYRSEFADPTMVDAWRLNYDGRNLNINAVLFPDMKKRYMTMMCSEGLNDGL